MSQGPLGGPRPQVEIALKVTAVFDDDIENPHTVEDEEKLVREQMIQSGEKHLVKARPASNTDFNKCSIVAIGGVLLSDIKDFQHHFNHAQRSLIQANYHELRVSAVRLNRLTDNEVLVPRPFQEDTRLSLTAEGTPNNIGELEQKAQGVFGDTTVGVDIMDDGSTEGVAIRVPSEYATLDQLLRASGILKESLGVESLTMGVTVGEFEPITYSEE